MGKCILVLAGGFGGIGVVVLVAATVVTLPRSAQPSARWARPAA